mgnify:FL=1
MKRKYILLSVALGLGIGLSSCSDYLNVDKFFNDRMSLEDVFKSEDYSERWLATSFSFLAGSNSEVASKGHTPFCFADDMYFGDRDDFYKRLKNGEYGEGDQQGSWGACYEGIRQASIFINNIDINEDFTQETIADYKAQARFVRAYYYWLLLRKYGPIPLLPEEGLDYTESYDNLACARSTYDECANYIASEMALAAKDLPLERGSLSIARPTRGAALAARARALLYAASPINNPRPSDTEKFVDLVDDQGKKLISQEYNEEKWARAAAAARDVIELPGKNNGHRYELFHKGIRLTDELGYPKTVAPQPDGDFSEKNWPEGYKDIDPFESYRALFNGDAAAETNPELIFTRGQNQSTEGISVMVGHQLPRITAGWNTHGLTQKQCDAYYMADGTDCLGKERELNIPGRSDMEHERPTGFVSNAEAGTAGGYEHLSVGVSKQYAGREPRFYASVAYNGSVWYLLNTTKEEDRGPKQVFYYRGDGNGYTNTMFWLRTGIGVMKFVNPYDANDNNSNDGGWTHIRKKPEPAIRYAEILLIYAEAINELNGSYDVPSWDREKTYILTRTTDELKKGIRPVRCRAGVPDYTPSEYENPTLFRTKLKRERQIELMGEGQRYYDLRRWKDSEMEEALPVYGCNVLMTSDNTNEKELFHTPVVISSLPTTFSRKMYFWPISHSELKRNKKLTQNPGWTYND